MYITGQFRGYNNALYTVHILSNNDKSVTKTIGEDGLYFGATPITIEQNNDDTFETIIRKSCTINLITKDYIGADLFAANSRNIKVNVYRGNNCIFAGYVEPNTFTQPFTSPLDEFSINCTDALSTLQYYNYNDVTIKNYESSKSSANVVTFKSIIDNMFDEIVNLDIANGTTGIIYYDMSKGINSGRTKTIFSDISMSELNMIGDDADDTWTDEETLNEILQYLNLHIIQQGLNYYIFDWNTIKKKRSSWMNLATNAVTTYTPSTVNLMSDMHSSDDTSISIADVYNQIQVKCDLENQENVIESPLDSDSLTSYYSGKQLYMTEYISEGEGSSAHNAFKAMVKDQTTTYDGAKIVDWYVQNMVNKNWKFNTLTGTIENTFEYADGKYKNQWKTPKYLRDNQLTPAIFRMGSVEKKPKTTDNSPTSKIDMSDYLFISINGNENDTESSHSPTDNSIANHSPMIEYVGNSSGGVFSPTDDKTTNYLVFSGKLLFQPIQKETDTFANVLANIDKMQQIYGIPYYWHKTVPSDNNGDGRYYTRKFYTQEYPSDNPTSYLTTGTSLHPWTKDKANHIYKYNYSANGDSTDKYTKLPVLECELIIGNKRLIETNIDEYGNSTFRWVTLGNEPTQYYDGTAYKVTTFTLGVNPKIGDYIIGDEYAIQNTISYTMNLDAEGTAIPISKSDNLSGAVIFRILGPVNNLWNDITRRHPTFFRHTKWYDNWHFLLSHMENIIIKDFECKVYSDGAGNEINEDNDLIYMSAETDRFINKKDDIEFKFITQLSSSECLEKGISAGVNLNATINATTNQPLATIYNATTNETAKPEEHYVDQYYTAYSAPKIIMETSLHNTSDIDWRNIYYSKTLRKNFFIQSIGYELREGTAQITFKEI